MRFSIMVQLVSIITVILMATAAMFAWLQTRTSPQAPQSQSDNLLELGLLSPGREEDSEEFHQQQL
jgi:flagellar basal body-associated protein FliL